jgi:SAM-dependent methyltransferase
MTVYGKDFAAVYDKKFAFWGPKVWTFLSPIVKNEIRGAKTWLDLCCGAGSLLRFVDANGCAATGVDVSKHQLRHARRNVPNARLFAGDIRQLSIPQKFDVVTCMFDSLNYLTVKGDLLQAFRKAKRHLKRGGLFAFDMNTFAGLRDQWCKTSAIQERDLTLIVETSFDARRALGRCLITGFVRKGKTYRKFQEEHLERGYRADEIEGLLQSAGFSFRKYDGHEFTRPKKQAARLLYICKSEVL